MVAISVDMSDLNRIATMLGAAADQLPFVCALALNAATEKTRQHLIKTTWPSHVRPTHNRSFIAASLTTKDARATKNVLSTEIFDKLERGHLYEQARGGVRVPHGRAHVAVPVSAIPRTARGVPRNLRPRQLANSVRIKDALYTRDKSGRLKLMYVLKTATKIPKRVPFYEDFQTVMRRELLEALPAAIGRAMATRRGR
jgi:hypothetical protein